MLILHAIASLDPDAGGPPQVAYRLACAQASLGHEVHLLAYGGDSVARQRLEAEIGGASSLGRVTMHELPPPTRAELLLGREARAFFRTFLGKTDILHLHGVWESILRLGAAEARRQGKPYVVVPHGMLDPWSLSQKKLKKHVALAMGYRAMLDQAAFLQCLNADERRLLWPLRLACRTRTIPNGVFLEDFENLPARGVFRQLHPEVGDAPYVLFLSRLHYKKGLDHLADAFGLLATKLPDVRLVVAGPDSGARGDFEARIRAAHLAGRTHVLGPVYGAEKLASFVDAAAFCLPSRQEGFSVATLEAMACGIPVVISENCHFPEVARASAGYVVPLEATAMADALLKVLTDPEKSQRMGKSGQRLVQQDYTWPAIARLAIDNYAQVIGAGR